LTGSFFFVGAVKGNPVDLDFSPVQACSGLQEAQRAQTALNISGKAFDFSPFSFEQEYCPRPDLFRAELIRVACLKC